MATRTTAIHFDMRAPAFGAPITELYAAALDMAGFADAMGITRIGLMEHHGSDDGYLPTPFVLAGGVVARTRRCRINLGAVILPLHDPVKIAEQIAVLDIMSGGRLEVIFGAGYVPSEFALFNVSVKDRGRLLDEGIAVILRALKGERFEAGGREIFVRPLPLQSPERILLAGGGVEASAKRAARFGIGFAPMNPALLSIYEEECRRLGHEPGPMLGSGLPLSIHVAEDPAEGWKHLWRHAAHVAEAYAKWAGEDPKSTSPFRGLDNEAALRQSGMFAVWTPDEVLAHARKLSPHDALNFMPLLGGLDPKIGWESLHLLKTKVMPRLTEGV